LDLPGRDDRIFIYKAGKVLQAFTVSSTGSGACG